MDIICVPCYGCTWFGPHFHLYNFVHFSGKETDSYGTVVQLRKNLSFELWAILFQDREAHKQEIHIGQSCIFPRSRLVMILLTYLHFCPVQWILHRFWVLQNSEHYTEHKIVYFLPHFWRPFLSFQEVFSEYSVLMYG